MCLELLSKQHSGPVRAVSTKQHCEPRPIHAIKAWDHKNRELFPQFMDSLRVDQLGKGLKRAPLCNQADLSGIQEPSGDAVELQGLNEQRGGFFFSAAYKCSRSLGAMNAEHPFGFSE